MIELPVFLPNNAPMRSAPLAFMLLLALASCAEPRPALESGIAPLTIERTDIAALSDNLLLVDKSERKLTLFHDGAPSLTITDLRFGDMPVGHKRFEGDERTPEGLYKIDARNPQSGYHLSLRISYPNASDRAAAGLLGRDPGGDIFLHGQPNGYAGPAIATDWTDGCIAMTNAEIEALYAAVADGTPIFIRP